MFPSRELKILPLGWGSGVSSEAGICANMGLGEGLLPGRVEAGVGSMAGEPRPPVEDAPSWPQPPLHLAAEAPGSLLLSPPSLLGVLGQTFRPHPAGPPGLAKALGGPTGNRGLCVLLLALVPT